MLSREAKTSLNNIKTTWKQQIAANKLNTAQDHLYLVLSKVSIIADDLKFSDEKAKEVLEVELKKAFTPSNNVGYKTIKDNISLLATYQLTSQSHLSPCKFEEVSEKCNPEIIMNLTAIALQLTKSW